MIRPNEKGLTVDIYKPANGTDCTLDGVTSRAKYVLLLGVDGPTTIADNERYHKYPVLRVIEHPAVKGYMIAVPAGHEGPTTGHYAFGSNFVYSSDSRFRKVCAYPIPVHDRDMGKERR